MHVLIWGARTAPSSRDGRDAQGKMKQNVIFSPQRPPNQPEYTYPARKYLSSQKILIQPENTHPARKYVSLLSISHRTGTVQPCQAESRLNQHLEVSGASPPLELYLQPQPNPEGNEAH